MDDRRDESTSSAPELRGFSVELETATGPVRGKLAVNSGPMRLAELVPLAAQIADIFSSRAVAAEETEGRTLSCALGCAACCRQLVALSIPEVLFLGEVVGRQSQEHREALVQRFDGVIGRLQRSGLMERLAATDLDEEESNRLASEYFLMGLDCPFLEDETCGIHALRPTRCREHGVTSPPAWCASPFESSPAALPMPRPLAEALALLTAELTGEPARLVPLTLAPVWARSHPDLAHRTWPGPDLFARFMSFVKGHPTGKSEPESETGEDE